jgi:hypothetical protein
MKLETTWVVSAICGGASRNNPDFGGSFDRLKFRVYHRSNPSRKNGAISPFPHVVHKMSSAKNIARQAYAVPFAGEQ